MKITPALIYEDKEIFVSLTPDEFSHIVEKYVDKSELNRGIDEAIKLLKKKSLTI